MKQDLISPYIAEKLGYYVYLYINPLNGQIFYVGKGEGRRCLAHLYDQAESNKVQTIREIQAAGLDPIIEILVHGLEDEVTAFKIEAAVIDLIGKGALTNQVRGYESVTFGRMPLEILSAIYQREPARIDEPALLIRVNKTYRYGMSEKELYDFTRGVWKVGERRNKARYAFCVYAGIVREVYRIDQWFPAGTTLNTRPTAEINRPGRWEFIGESAEEDIRQKYLLKSVEAYFTKGTQNPITYVNC